jgi:hypothetical protein
MQFMSRANAKVTGFLLRKEAVPEPGSFNGTNEQLQGETSVGDPQLIEETNRRTAE